MSKIMDFLFPDKRIKYRKNGDIDYRSQAGRALKAQFDSADAEQEETQRTVDQILAEWDSLDSVDRAEHVLTNSHTYRIAQYARTTPISEQDYYYNQNGELTARYIDRQNYLPIETFLRKPKTTDK